MTLYTPDGKIDRNEWIWTQADKIADAHDALVDRVKELERDNERISEVIDANTKGVYSKYLLEAADAMAENRHWKIVDRPALESRLKIATEALRIIAGEQQRVDNLLSNMDIACAALAQIEGREP